MTSDYSCRTRSANTILLPFRSMGFVSVIIVSVLFALGLPLVLL